MRILVRHRIKVRRIFMRVRQSMQKFRKLFSLRDWWGLNLTEEYCMVMYRYTCWASRFALFSESVALLSYRWVCFFDPDLKSWTEELCLKKYYKYQLPVHDKRENDVIKWGVGTSIWVVAMHGRAQRPSRRCTCNKWNANERRHLYFLWIVLFLFGQPTQTLHGWDT